MVTLGIVQHFLSHHSTAKKYSRSRKTLYFHLRTHPIRKEKKKYQQKFIIIYIQNIHQEQEEELFIPK